MLQWRQYFSGDFEIECDRRPPSTLTGQIMMRPLHFAVALAGCAFSAVISAQPAPQAPAVPDGSPATAVPPEEGAPSRVPRTVVTEKRERGQVTGATVTQGNNTYHLRPNTPVGSAQPGDAQSSGNRAAQWQVLQFDWQRQTDAPKPPAPPAPPAPVAPSAPQK